MSANDRFGGEFQRLIHISQEGDCGLPARSPDAHNPKEQQSPPKCLPDTNESKLMCFADAACGNNPAKNRSTAGHAVAHGGGTIMCQSKAHSMTAPSSTEAELIAAVTTAKNIKHVRSMFDKLGPPMEAPAPTHEDNKSAIKIINADKPTGRSRHMDIWFFAIQGWKEDGHITVKHTPGAIDPADDLTKPLRCVPHSRHARCMMGHRCVPKETT